MYECDICGREDVPKDEQLLMCTPRPSNPSSLCWVLAACTHCTKPDKWTNTAEKLEEYVESDEARKDGIIFLEI